MNDIREELLSNPNQIDANASECVTNTILILYAILERGMNWDTIAQDISDSSFIEALSSKRSDNVNKE